MIWVTTSTVEARWTKFWIFYLWMVIIYVYSVGMVLWARSQIYKGLEETLASRKYQVSKQTRYVIGYCCFWTAVFFLQFLIYLSSEGITSFSMTDYQADVVRSSSAFLLASRGICAQTT
ncbi:hypothetical protein B484DRAFT_409960 [Ochromonadaceae sp. CCMP2298]|nr:hypothetical protein B484DRAFT_409960 [Ochromonadaceae sp. CCMP2298]